MDKGAMGLNQEKERKKKKGKKRKRVEWAHVWIHSSSGCNWQNVCNIKLRKEKKKLYI